MKPKILLAGGGTGGHFFPALAIAEELCQSYDIHIITDKRCSAFVTNYLDNGSYAKLINFHISDLYIKYWSIIGKLTAPFLILKSILKAIVIIFKIKPALIVGFGGYPTMPALLVAKLFKIPIFLHEQNSHIGKVNRFFAPSAKLITHSSKKLDNMQFLPKNVALKYIGHIVRHEILRKKPSHKYKSERIKNKFNIFIFGGAGGASSFNNILPEAIKIAKVNYPEIKFNIIQQVKGKYAQSIGKIYEKHNIDYELQEFFHNSAEIYALTDLVICRAGAGTIAELISLNIPAILIPLPNSSEDHQLKNALYVQNEGGGWCVRESEDIVNIIAQKLIELYHEPEILDYTRANLQKLENDGVRALADTVKEYMQKIYT